MTDVHFFVYGRVQGVGFRRFVLDIANKNGLTGWVRNASDSSVEVYACGQSKDIATLINSCQKGPIFASVNNILFADNKDIPLPDDKQGYSSFFIWR